jgi:hypothetical protein
MSEEFNPSERMITVRGGAAYLQVKDRVLWFRHEHPQGSITTEMLRLDDTTAVFKAEVTVPTRDENDEPSFSWVATGHGSETAGDWRDYIEKAETKAIGRALAAAGFGTQAAFEEAPERPADSPVARDAPRTQIPAPPARENRQSAQSTAPARAREPQGQKIALQQVREITSLFDVLGIALPDRQRFMEETIGQSDYNRMTVAQGESLTSALREEKARFDREPAPGFSEAEWEAMP